MMKEEKQVVVQWIKAHKKELKIAGISLAAIICLIVGIKKKEALVDLWKSLQKQVNDGSVGLLDKTQEVLHKTEIIDFPLKQNALTPIEVSKHVRNLPDGWKASEGKVSSAIAHGYQLKIGQTWVDTYNKNTVTA